ncbi:MAG: SDR family oxidoreductase [Halobacteria archaeon]|nr:SDR family oxidoreductase [Halobacteria archaeon]
MDLDIQGNVALVTASSSGLGKASARALASEGANVAINGRDEGRLENAVKELEEVAEGKVIGVQGDLTSGEDIEDLVQTTVDEFGRLDHLVTSSGGPPSGSFLDMSDDDWYDAFDLLVMSVVRVVRESVPHLRSDGGGTIVNITSRSVKEAVEALVLSNSVRMSVIGLEKTLSRELAPEIRVNSVLPGTIETARIQELIEQGIERGDYDSYDEGISDWSEGIPRGSIGEPEEFGEVVAFLCSERSSYINGDAIRIDGGQTRSNL